MTDIAYSGAAVSYTAPNAGIYTITAYGAQGGSGGDGAEASGVFRLTAGEVLSLAVGGAGTYATYSGGGGGGSFVVAPANVPLVVAGGGGGQGFRAAISVTNTGQTTTSGANATADNGEAGGAGGTGGAGGDVGSGGSYGSELGGGGGGFTGSGATGGGSNSGTNSGVGGRSYAAGLAGGTGGADGNGGFGGGGGGSYDGGGGGGGYSGGGGGGGQSGGGGSGGGGGSYVDASATSVVLTAGARAGNGLIQITPANITGAGVIYLASNLDVTFNPVFQGGTFQLNQAGATYTDNFSLDGSTTNTIDLAGNSATLSGVVSDLTPGVKGNIAVTNSGAGNTVTLSGANTYTGTTTISNGATLRVGNASALGVNSAVIDNGAGNLDLFGNSPTIGSLNGSGYVTNYAPDTLSTLTTGTLNAASTFSGVISDYFSGQVALTKVGTGSLTLSGANTFTGATTVSGGTLAVDGAFASAITVQSGATLRGTGTSTAAVTINANATFAPGDTTGVFTSSTLSEAGVFAETIGTGGAFEQARTTAAAAGAVNLAGSSLAFNYTGGAEAFNTAYTIIQATNAGTVTGAFSNAATSGSLLVSNGHTFRVDYASNTVTLTDITAPPSISGAQAGQMVTDKGTVKPFSSVTVGDTNASPSDTVTLTVTAGGVASDADGVLSGTGLTKTGVGTYSLAAGSPGAVTSILDALLFTPTANQVAPGGTVTTGFTIKATDAVGSTSNSTTTVVATSVNDAPAIAGSQANQPVGDHATINPFATVTVADPDTGQGETVTVTLSNAANGTLSGGGFAATATPGVYSVTVPAGGAGASAAAAQADLRAAVFTPTAAPAGTPATATTFTIAVNDGTATTSDANTSTSTTHTTNTTPVLGGFAAGQQVNDNATLQPFKTVTVTDPDLNQTETVTVTLSAAANGTLAGGGFAAVSGSPGVYRVAAPDAATAQADLQALVFTPTANEVAPGQSVTTGFTVQVNDTQTTVQNATTTVVATSINDAPAFGGFTSSGGAVPFGASVVLQPSLTVTDPDVGAQVSTSSVSITGGFTAGDVLTVANPQAGITAAYNAATGVLTLTGAASDQAYQTELNSVTFSRPNSFDSGAASRTFVFSVTDDQGATTTSGPETLTANYGSLGTGGGTTATVPTNLDAQQLFPTQTSNLTRAPANDPAFSTPTSPLYAQAQAEKGIAAQLDSGQISLADAQNALYHLVDGSTSVAEISYAFFTGKTPTQAGLNYLVHSAVNTTDLNDPYYAQFTTENRYINFANNLATGPGAGAAAFQANYGSLSLADATAQAYAAIFGTTAAADKISAILDAQVSNGLGGTETRAQYLADITGGSAISQKAAVVGFLLADSVKEGFGLYQQADLHFLQDLAHGTAVFNVDLLAAYTQAPTLVGQPVADTTLGG